MKLRLRKGSKRNTQAHTVDIGPHEFFFSYETCIAYRGPSHVHGMRIANHWGPTTGRHFADMGCREFTMVDDETFEKIVAAAIQA